MEVLEDVFVFVRLQRIIVRSQQPPQVVVVAVAPTKIVEEAVLVMCNH